MYFQNIPILKAILPDGNLAFLLPVLLIVIIGLGVGFGGLGLGVGVGVGGRGVTEVVGIIGVVGVVGVTGSVGTVGSVDTVGITGLVGIRGVITEVGISDTGIVDEGVVGVVGTGSGEITLDSGTIVFAIAGAVAERIEAVVANAASLVLILPRLR